MPQLKKPFVSSNNILPKVNMKFTQFSEYDNESVISPSYLTLLIEDGQTSEPESDVSDSVQNRPRKRQRLDHLSQEEKILRRKLKNRVAAQTARDRKKARMQELEDQVAILTTEKRLLSLKTVEHLNKIRALETENLELKKRLGLGFPQNIQKVEPSEEKCEASKESSPVLSDECRSLEQAEGAGSADSFTLDDALCLLASNSQPDDFLDLLQQCGDMEYDFNDTNFEGETKQQLAQSLKVVGSTSKSLESNKELIHFDHIYSKQDETPCSSLAGSELSTKDSHLLLSSDINLTNIVEIDQSSPDVPVISIPFTPESQLEEDVLSDSFSFGEINENLLCPPSDERKSCSSPASSSDAGYDSSFSVSSPCANPWDDTLTELFPSLV